MTGSSVPRSLAARRDVSDMARRARRVSPDSLSDNGDRKKRREQGPPTRRMSPRGRHIRLALLRGSGQLGFERGCRGAGAQERREPRSAPPLRSPPRRPSGRGGGPEAPARQPPGGTPRRRRPERSHRLTPKGAPPSCEHGAIGERRGVHSVRNDREASRSLRTHSGHIRVSAPVMRWHSATVPKPYFKRFRAR